MNKIIAVFAALMLPVFLSACQTSQSATSSYSGNAIGTQPVKNASTQKAFRNEAGILSKEKRAEVLAYNSALAGKSATRATSAAIKSSKKIKRKTPQSTKSVIKSTKAVRKSKKRVKSSSRRGRYRKIIAKHARAHGVPLKLAMAVVQVESNYRANARGAAGEIGLMQLMPRTARFIGYKGKLKHLYNPDTNIRYGMKYLGKAYRLGRGSTCGTILKYNAGHGAKRMNPISRKYCKRVKRILRKG